MKGAKLAYFAGTYSFLAPIVVFYYYVLRYATNFPEDDDYAAVLLSIIDFIDARSLGEKIRVLFHQHNEHRILYGRAVEFVQYYISGSVDFKTLIVLGNLGLIVMTFLLFIMFRPEEDRLLLFAPGVFFLFHIQYWESIFRAMAILQWTGGFMFGFTALYLLAAPGRGRLAGAALCAAISFFTIGSGILIFITGALLLLLGRRWKESVLWILTAAVASLLYFYNYVHPGAHPPVTEAFLYPSQTFMHFINLISAAVVDLIVMTATPIIASLSWDVDVDSLRYGMALLLFGHFAYLVWKRYYKKNPPLFGALFFLYASCVLVALTRSGFGSEQAMMWRYRILSSLIFALVFLTTVEVMSKERRMYVYVPFLIFAVLFNILSFVEFRGQVRDKFNERNMQMVNYLYNRKTGNPLPGNGPILMEAEKKHIYTPSMPVLNFD